jgi:formylglycine-generating enzyme required for sulfatase activity
VEGGEFMMGATAEQEDDARDKEKPAHKVQLDSFYIGETLVTHVLWDIVMGNVVSLIRQFHHPDNHPVKKVWDDCLEFIKRLNKLTGKQFRLLTEAEWEYAARGGNRSRGYKYAGSNNLSDVAWFRDNSDNQIHSVAQKQPNELGIYDMSGNVYEWCNDWYYRWYYSKSPKYNPQGADFGGNHVLRGGSNSSIAGACRVSYRSCGGFGGLRLSLSVK